MPVPGFFQQLLLPLGKKSKLVKKGNLLSVIRHEGHMGTSQMKVE